jgi:hypothetical protein
MRGNRKAEEGEGNGNELRRKEETNIEYRILNIEV